jgi:hypothetical protein
MYKDKPCEHELRNEFKSGSLQLLTVRSFDWDGKPATSKIIRDFIASTPVVSPCAHPRCISRLVIVPKLDPGQNKDSLEHGFRVTVNALFNKCLKPAASTIPLATSEIKKLHNKKFFTEIEAMLTGARPFSGPSLPFCLPVIATRSIVLSIGAESSG